MNPAVPRIMATVALIVALFVLIMNTVPNFHPIVTLSGDDYMFSLLTFDEQMCMVYENQPDDLRAAIQRRDDLDLDAVFVHLAEVC